MIPPRARTIRRTGPVVAAVFVVSAGIGALIFALAHHGRRVVVVRTSPAVAQPSASGPHSTPARRGRPARSALVPAGTSASFSRLAASTGGALGLAVAPLGQGAVQTFGPLQLGHAWSTMKVPVLVTYMREAEAAGAQLNASVRELATRAIEQSDNGAINAIFAALEQSDGGLTRASLAVEHTLQLAGDTATHVNTVPNPQGFSTFGQTEWSASASAIFYRALARRCLLSPADTDYVVGLLRNVTSDQRWGVGQGGFPSTVPVAFKGGWGPEPSGTYLVRQTAVIGSGTRGYVASLLVMPSIAGAASFAAGQELLTQLASWARRTLDLSAQTPSASCG